MISSSVSLCTRILVFRRMRHMAICPAVSPLCGKDGHLPISRHASAPVGTGKGSPALAITPGEAGDALCHSCKPLATCLPPVQWRPDCSSGGVRWDTRQQSHICPITRCPSAFCPAKALASHTHSSSLLRAIAHSEGISPQLIYHSLSMNLASQFKTFKFQNFLCEPFQHF